MTKKHFEFNITSLTIGDWFLINAYVKNPGDSANLMRLLARADECTNADIMALPIERLNDVLVEFAETFELYMIEHGLRQ